MKSLIAQIVLVFFSLSFTLGVFDITVYLLPKQYLPGPLLNVTRQMEVNSGSYYREDSELGHTIKPGTDFLFPGEEFSFRLQTRLNFPDAGFRGGTLGGPVWGAAFGDSFTFGAGVDQAASWVARLSELANREVINFGVPGQGTHQYTRIFQRYGAPLRPKLILYALFPNDLEDAVRFQRRLAGRKRKTSLRQFMKEHSVSYNLFRNLSRSLKRKRSKDQNWDGIGLKLLDRKLRSPYGVPDENFASAWDLASEQIDEAIEESKRINATFVLFYFPSKEEVYWELDKEKVKPIERFEERIVRLRKTTLSFCQSRQLLCLDLSPALKIRGLRGEILYFPVDIHWNEKGNLIVAQEIHKFLVENNLLP